MEPSLYLLDQYRQIQQQHLPIPSSLFPPMKTTVKGQRIISTEINETLMLYFIRAGGIREKRRPPENPEFAQQLEEFYLREYQPFLEKEKYDLINRHNLIEFLAQQMQTGFNNSVSVHFLTRIRRLMNLLKPELIDKYLFAKIKHLILSNHDELIPQEYQAWGQQIKQFLPPQCQICYGYDAKVHPEKYLYYLIKMNDHLEQHNRVIQQSNLSNDEKRKQTFKLFQPIPLRTSLVPCYITIDADVITKQLLKTDQYKKDEIWSQIFDTKKRVMQKKGYQFKSIQTDGIGVSICFQRRCNKTNPARPEIKIPYLDELSDQQISDYHQRIIIGCDPGKHDLIHLIDKERKQLCYTSNQRRHESQSKRASEILLAEKIKHQINPVESQLSEQSSKTVNYQKFQEYIGLKTRIDQQISWFYQEKLFRKTKWRSQIAKRQSEDQLLNRIEQTYGSPDQVVIGYGNWSQTKQMKYLVPTLGKGMRKIIGRRFDMFLVDEWGTSKYCNQCHHELEGYQGLYRVLRCPECLNSGLTSKKICFYNLDANAGMNILYLIGCWMEQRARPVPFRRTFDPDLTKALDSIGKSCGQSHR